MRDLAKIDRLVHEPARLMILMFLYTVESPDFACLLNANELTDGNLSSHLSKLEAAGTSRSRRATRARNLACA